ncbi:DUF3742 family protein [Pararhodobacter zhoushanensis]|uniref:DUF3742 family protein n=1 Tax=Pararhodobacter zhoushanensis TaxID=2479545 RepID=UPI0013DF8A12|nr:DUF3742 family protein [Pararhodobacter zhoushanensis]
MSGLAFLVNPTLLPDEMVNLALFVGLFPILNGAFDTLSYAATLGFMRRGLARYPVWMGVADLAVAAVIFLLLAATLLLAVAGMNALSGSPWLDLDALFIGLRNSPENYWWLYLMLFSTLLPTAAHATLALLGLQGVWPRAWRRRVAGWVRGAGTDPGAATGAMLGVAVLWFVPLAGVGALLAGVWWLGLPLFGAIGAGYLTAMEALARALGAV